MGVRAAVGILVHCKGEAALLQTAFLTFLPMIAQRAIRRVVAAPPWPLQTTLLPRLATDSQRRQHRPRWLSTLAAGDGGTGAAVPYQLVVRMDIPDDKEQLFNDVYNEHCENLRLVPGVLGIRRYKTGRQSPAQ